VTDLLGKTIIVSGAASGLGLASARAALAAGAEVCASDLDDARLQAVWSGAAACGEVLVQPIDLVQDGAGEQLVAAARHRFGKVDGLVSCAGVFDTRPLLEIGPADFDRIFAIHARGAFFLMQAVARAMVDQGTEGSIVNLASTAGRHGRPLAAHYAAAKAAVISFSRSAAVALAPAAIRVNCLCPGLIETPMIAEIREQRSALSGISPEEVTDGWRRLVPLGRLGNADEVSAVAVFLLSDAASYVTGEAIGITGGTDAS
jgi:NAD(P)-dependent dehydrogenase (short-subunit alcohol dehydrogenase family)